MIPMKKVGEILRTARQDKLLTFKDVAEQTKIHPRYLKALEEGDYAEFSSEIHLKGFLKNYASFLGVEPGEIMAFFRREYANSQERKTLSEAVKPINSPRFIITPGLILSILVLILLTVFFGYLFLEYRSFAGAPLLIVEQPSEERLTVNNPNLSIVGRSDPDAIVTINGQKISLGEGGIFSTPITLSGGLNVLNIVSTNKLGKQSQVTKTIVVEKNEGPPSELGEPEPVVSGANLELRIGPNAAWVEVYIDGKKEFDGLLTGGVTQKFSGQNDVRVVTGNAGSTGVVFNNQDLGPMGQEGEVVERSFAIEPQEGQQESTPSSTP